MQALRRARDGDPMSGQTAKAVRARGQHWCEGEWAHDRIIKPGDIYVRSVLFPGDLTDSIWVHRLCAVCAQHYPTTADLVAAYGGGAE
jgi:hypothetical protein